jgi:hypothetical protein
MWTVELFAAGEWTCVASGLSLAAANDAADDYREKHGGTLRVIG